MNYLCFDIGGTKTKFGILNDNYQILEKNQIDTLAYKGGDHILNNIINIINEYKLKYDLAGIAISTAGVVDHKKGFILYANDIIPNYSGLNLTKLIKDATGLNASIENDVNCFALSHTLLSNLDFLMVAIGTGIGGGIIINYLSSRMFRSNYLNKIF